METIRIPTGTRDVLPAEAAELRLMEDACRGVFSAFCYQEVRTPTLELESALAASGEESFAHLFRLFDDQGEVMVLRPEMTTPIVRLAATRMAEREGPLRLCYFAESFRPTTPQRGRQSEFRQAGVEFIGDDSPAVDAEVLAVLCRALDSCGLTEYSLALGEASFLRALLGQVGVPGDQQGAVFAALAARDMVRLDAVIDSLGAAAEDRQAIRDAVSLRGGPVVLTRAQELVRGPEMEGALRRLARTYYLLSRYGHAGRIIFDLGMLRDFDYYTGIVFEALSEGLGFPLGGGGRYNGLLARYGRQLPAVGFAVGLDRLHMAVNDQGGVAEPEAARVALAGGLDEELDLAQELREKNIEVFALAAGTSAEACREAALAANIGLVAIPEGEVLRLIEAESGKERRLSREKLAGAVAGREVEWEW